MVTGGGRGIGEAITRAFHAAGDRVAIVSRTDSGLAASLGERACHVAADVAVSASVDAAVAKVVRWGIGRLDVVVNNAGASIIGVAEELSLDDFRAQLDLNLFAAIQVTQLALNGRE